MASIMITQNIGKTMPHGYAGNYARQPDMIVNTFPAGGTENIAFGMPLKLDATGCVVVMGAGDTAAAFVGIAAREFKSSLSYLNQNVGEYAPGEAVSVFQRGAINALCQKGTPAYGAPVYVRIAANASAPTAVVGGFEAEADGANTIELKGCKWMGPADANKIAELRITTFPNTGVVNA
jgi:hypothetical protein